MCVRERSVKRVYVYEGCVSVCVYMKGVNVRDDIAEYTLQLAQALG